MSALTIQEILLFLTFLLTLINIVNGWSQARQRRMSHDPAIVDIQKQQLLTQSDVKYIRVTLDAQTGSSNAISQRIDGIERSLNDNTVRLVKLEEAVKTLQDKK